jgi:mannose-6-phosphate isomerase-like protein (cupin superfamily)
VSSDEEVTQSFEPDAFEVNDMRHLVIRPGEKSELDPSADVDFVTVLAGTGILRHGGVIQQLASGVKTKVDYGTSYAVEASGSEDLLLQIIGARATRRS